MRFITPPAITRCCLTLLLSIVSANSIAQDLAWPTASRSVRPPPPHYQQKAIVITGVAGSSVTAAADGKVVHAGDGVKDMGNLVIIQHENGLMTGYGNNQELFVQPGQMVKRGQKIATMGKTDATRVQLTFDVRLNGKPVDPLEYLPSIDTSQRPPTSALANTSNSKKGGNGSSGAAYYLTQMEQPLPSGGPPRIEAGLIAANSESHAIEQTLDIENRHNRRSNLPLLTVKEAAKCKPGWAANLQITNGHATARASSTCGLPSLQAAIQTILNKCKTLASSAQCGATPAQTGTAIFLTFVQIPDGKPMFSRIWGVEPGDEKNNLVGGYCLFQRDGTEKYFFVQGGSDAERCQSRDPNFTFVIQEMRQNGVLIR